MWRMYGIVVIACGVVLPVNAQWQLIDNFEQWEADDHFYDATDIGWNASAQEQTDEYWMLIDPVDSENIGMYVTPGNSGVSYATTFVMKLIPGGGINPGETGTLFFRCLWEGVTNRWHMATADKPLVYDGVTGLQTAPGSWGDLNALFRLGETKALEHRDGNVYVTTNPPIAPMVHVWYSFWMIVDNTWDMTSSPPTCTGIYTLYVQGEGIDDGVSPTLIPVGTDTPKQSASLRRAPINDEDNPQSIIWAVFITENDPPGSPSVGEPFYLDDFYFADGVNLTNPLCYGGYSVDGSRDVDSDDWLGWINVAKAPYIWSYSLNNWIYMEEPAADAPGGWAYVFK